MALYFLFSCLLRSLLLLSCPPLKGLIYLLARDGLNVCLLSSYLQMHLSCSISHCGVLYLSYKLLFHISSVSFRHSVCQSHWTKLTGTWQCCSHSHVLRLTLSSMIAGREIGWEKWWDMASGHTWYRKRLLEGAYITLSPFSLIMVAGC